MNKIIVNKFGGVLLRKEASVRFVSDDLYERGSEVRRKGVTPYGC